MKTCKNTVTRLMRVVKVGTALGVAIVAASALQAAPAVDEIPAPPPPAATDNTTPAPPTPPDAITPSSPSAPDTSASVSHRAKEFIRDAAQANQTEIAMADIAIVKSQNTTVKDLAQMMRTDHLQNYAQVQAIAQAHGVTLDSSLDSSHQRAVDRLQKASDADFDQAYTTVMLKDHVKCIQTFNKAAAGLGDTDVKQYAQSTLPTLRKHLHHSEIAAHAAGVDDATISSIMNELTSEERGLTVR